jgi:hypothetical protein
MILDVIPAPRNFPRTGPHGVCHLEKRHTDAGTIVGTVSEGFRRYGGEMPQSCKVCTSPDSQKINEALIATPNVSAVWRAIPTIAPEAQFSESALRRHHAHTALTITAHVDDGFRVSDALGLLVAAAEDVASVRAGALARGNLALLHRNALTAVAVAESIIRVLPKHDLNTLRDLRTGDDLLTAVAVVTRANPGVGADIATQLERLGEDALAADLRSFAATVASSQTQKEAATP